MTRYRIGMVAFLTALLFYSPAISRSASPDARAALKKLINIGDGLNLSADPKSRLQQFELHAFLSVPPTPQNHPNPLGFLVARDKNKVACILFSSEFQVPLIYATQDMAVLVSISEPGKLEYFKLSPVFRLSDDSSNQGYTFGMGLSAKPEITANIQGFLQGAMANMVDVTSKEDSLLVINKHTRIAIDLAKTINSFPIRELRLYYSTDTDPLFSISFHIGPPNEEWFRLTRDDLRKLKPGQLKEKEPELIATTSSTQQFAAYTMADLKKDPKILAAARELAKLLPQLSPPTKTLPPGHIRNPPRTKTPPNPAPILKF